MASPEAEGAPAGDPPVPVSSEALPEVGQVASPPPEVELVKAGSVDAEVEVASTEPDAEIADPPSPDDDVVVVSVAASVVGPEVADAAAAPALAAVSSEVAPGDVAGAPASPEAEVVPAEAPSPALPVGVAEVWSAEEEVVAVALSLAASVDE